MPKPLFPPKPLLELDILGMDLTYPVQRIFCVGRSYEAHAREMGFEADRAAPFYFNKSTFAAVHSGAKVPYAPATENLNYEMEMTVVLGSEVFQADAEASAAAIYGYGCGLDMTRRDLQIAYREKGRPWSMGKDFENAAVLGDITAASDYAPMDDAAIWLDVNGTRRQESTLGCLIWTVPEMISHLSYMYHLGPGDVIMTGTPEGVGPVVTGDVLTGGVSGLAPIALEIGPKA